MIHGVGGVKVVSGTSLI